MSDYSSDFAVRNTAGALSALVKSIISKTYLLHYGTDFLPFLEMLPSMSDEDADWAIKIDDMADESDDSYSFEDEEHHIARSTASSEDNTKSKERERKRSIPTARSLIPNSGSTVNSDGAESEAMDPRRQLRELQKIAQSINETDSDHIAQEITRMEVKIFLEIEVSAWLLRYSQ